MRIGYLPNDMDAPGFYRCLSPGKQLHEHGVEVFMPPRTSTETKVWKPYLDHYGEPILDGDGDAYSYSYMKVANEFKLDLAMPPKADLWVLQQRKERMWAEEATNRLRMMGAAIAADVDDDYTNLPEYNPAFYGTHPYRHADGHIVNRAMRRNLKRQTGFVAPPNKNNARHMLEHLTQVDLLTVSTPALANRYERYCKNIKVVRNYVDWDIWNDITPQYEVERGRVRIGYLGVFSYRRGDLKILQRVIPRFLRDHPEVDFVTNSIETHVYLNVPVEQRITIGEYTFQSLDGDLPLGRMTAVCDIGLVPLAMNDMNEAKSHLKGMEYNAAGIPFIASPTESYKDYWCEEGVNGYIAHSESDWYSQMEWLVKEDAHRRRMGVMARGKARRHCIQENWREWHNVYSELVGGEHHERARRAIGVGAVQKVSELAPFLKIVAEKRPKVIVEIGTARGGTFWAMAQTAPDDALLISMDIPGGSPLDVRNGKDVYTGRNREALKHFIKPTQTLKTIDMNSQLPMALATLQHALEGKKIDLLFIDGDHRYEGVKHDYETYGQLVAPGGIIAFHDIVTHEDKRVGVHKLWAEIKAESETQEFIGPESWGFRAWGGIGVVRV